MGARLVRLGHVTKCAGLDRCGQTPNEQVVALKLSDLEPPVGFEHGSTAGVVGMNQPGNHLAVVGSGNYRVL